MNQEELDKASDMMTELVSSATREARKNEIRSLVRKAFINEFYSGFWIGALLTAFGIVFTAWLIQSGSN